jgi:hypothetical protein
MPFTYLGLPLGTVKPTITKLSPLVCRLERKLSASSSFLSQGARLQLINFSLASMPLHFLCSLQFPVGLTVQLDRILRQCLWRDREGEPKQSLSAWEMICKPKVRGGLGIVNFQKQNATLLINFLGKFYNKKDLPWVNLIWEKHYAGKVPHAENLCGSFWCEDVLRQVNNFRVVARVKMGTGDTFLFWSDKWLIDGVSPILQNKFPRLFSFVLNKEIMAAEVYARDNIAELFYTPLSQSAFTELQDLQTLMQQNPVTGSKDEWTHCWGGNYASIKFYSHNHEHIKVPKVYKWIWQSSCMMKTKVFAWLLLVDRLNTRDLLQRRHWNVTDLYHCELCPMHVHEDRIHLFF